MTMPTPTNFPIECGKTTIYAAPLPHLPKTQRHPAERQAIASLISENISPTAHLDHLPSGAPIIIDSQLHISISHGAGLALLAVNPDNPIGIDIEAPRPQLLRIAPRFMDPEEYHLYGHTLDTALAVWTAKEATFKAAAIPGLTIGEIHIDLDSRRAAARTLSLSLHHFHWPDRTLCLAHPLNL